MSLIPAQRTVEKETLSLRLERTLHERLKQYAAFIKSPKDYVIAQALRRFFEKDLGAWLKRRGEGAPDASQDVAVPAARTRVAPAPVNGSRTRAEE